MSDSVRNVLALDLSLTRSGYATACTAGVLIPPRSAARGMARLAWIRDRVLELAIGVELVVLEGYSFGSRNSQAHALGELGGVVRLALHEAGVPIVDVPPSTLKRFATGKGNAGKEEMLAAAIRRLEYSGHDNNEADALFLLHAALTHYGMPGAVEVPKLQRAALAVVEWPSIMEAVHV